MPVTYQFHAEAGLVETRCPGDVRFDEVLAHFEALAVDPALPARLDVLLVRRVEQDLHAALLGEDAEVLAARVDHRRAGDLVPQQQADGLDDVHLGTEGDEALRHEVACSNRFHRRLQKEWDRRVAPAWPPLRGTTRHRKPTTRSTKKRSRPRTHGGRRERA